VAGLDQARGAGSRRRPHHRKPDQLVPLRKAPVTWASSSRADAPVAAVAALRAAHKRLVLDIGPNSGWHNPSMANCAGQPPPAPSGNKTGRKVFCVKFQKDLPGLDAPPWPGELGQRIFENVSMDAWKLWEDRMKMILNEYRLMPWQKEAQELVAKHMEDFFFGQGAALRRVRPAAE
jgi:Fe-S cluster biosynthesis and repair protein YggX